MNLRRHYPFAAYLGPRDPVEEIIDGMLSGLEPMTDDPQFEIRIRFDLSEIQSLALWEGPPDPPPAMTVEPPNPGRTGSYPG